MIRDDRRRGALAMRLDLVLAVALAGWTCLAPALAAAQSSARCSIPSFRGAGGQFGAYATMTVMNDGKACSFAIYVDPESRTPPDQLRIVTAPSNGTLTLTQPHTVNYTPNAGFVGADRFAYAGSGLARGGHLVQLSVTMSVTVLPGPAAPQKP